MNKNRLIQLVIIMLLLSTCATFKKDLVKTGYENEMIHNAVLDFSNKCRLYKRDSIFYVYTQEISNNVTLVSIGSSNMKVLLTKKTIIGSKGMMVSRYIDKDGKLFYWWDDDYPLKKETLVVFNKYDLLQDDKDGTIFFPDFTTDDSQKGVHYYFCNDNLTKYRRIITNKGAGYYTPPKLKCNE